MKAGGDRGTRRTGVDGTGKTVVEERVLGDGTRADVLGREHASGGENSDEGVEGRLGGVLR